MWLLFPGRQSYLRNHSFLIVTELLSTHTPMKRIENHHGPIDWTTLIMIDAERGAVEWLGSKTNDYCARESDWMHRAAMPFMKKLLRTAQLFKFRKRLMSSTPPPFFASKCQISHPSRNKKRTFGLAASSIGSPANFLPTKE